MRLRRKGETISEVEEFCSLLRALSRPGEGYQEYQLKTCAFCTSLPETKVDKEKGLSALYFLATSCFTYKFEEQILREALQNAPASFLCQAHVEEVESGLELIEKMRLLTGKLEEVKATLKSAVLNKVIANVGKHEKGVAEVSLPLNEGTKTEEILDFCEIIPVKAERTSLASSVDVQKVQIKEEVIVGENGFNLFPGESFGEDYEVPCDSDNNESYETDDGHDQEWSPPRKMNRASSRQRRQKSNQLPQRQIKMSVSMEDIKEEIQPNKTKGKRRNRDPNRPKRPKRPPAASEEEKMERIRASKIIYNHSKKRKKRFVCAVCKTYFPSPEERNEHTKTHDNDPEIFPCHLCSRMYRSEILVSRHIFRNHGTGVETHQCEQCPMKFFTYEKLRRHVEKIHPKEPKEILTCSICNTGKRYNGRRMLDTHIRNIHKNKLKLSRQPQVCEQCGKVYSSKELLKVHVDKEHLKIHEKVVCSECGKALSDAAALRKHKLSQHMKSYQYKCELCGNETLFKSHYISHLKSAHASNLSEEELEELIKNCRKIRDNSDRIYGPSVPIPEISNVNEEG